ncbi:MAG: hypothetical protein IJS90_00710 [Clostridia bacterium]|nr:hypothetical protein [Clostridia bacterium]
MKKAICVILSVILMFSCLVFTAGAEDETVFSNAAELMTFVLMGKEFTTPIRVVPAVLSQNGEEKEIFLVVLLGVKQIKEQVNSTSNLFAAAFNKDNSYVELIKEVVFENVPKGGSIVFACHSLGGMVAQRLRTDAELIESYDIVHTVTSGSPYIITGSAETEGGLVRLCDKFDAVPYLSPATLFCLSKQIKTATREDGGYLFDPDGAHNLSYMRSDVWGKYDALGFLGGDAEISFNPALLQSFGDM